MRTGLPHRRHHREESRGDQSTQASGLSAVSAHHARRRAAMSALTPLATVWLDGCSGCHMSLLDMDERLIELSSQFRLVYSPLVDCKVFPEHVDVTLVEGAVASEDDLKKIRKIREHTRLLVSLGDCALTGNVSAMRNSCGTQPILLRVYQENA